MVYINKFQRFKSSKHDTLTQCWVNADPLSPTSAQHLPSIGSTYRVCWESFKGLMYLSTQCMYAIQSVPAQKKYYFKVITLSNTVWPVPSHPAVIICQGGATLQRMRVTYELRLKIILLN